MPKFINPYHPGEIPASNASFFGRETLATWVEQQLIARRRIMIIHGPALVGKTTFLEFLPNLLAFDCLPVSLAFSHLSDYRPAALLGYLAEQLARRLQAQGLNPEAGGTPADAPDPLAAADRLLAQLEVQRPRTELLLTIDDADALPSRPDAEAWFSALETLLTRRDHLSVILMVNSASLPHLRHPLLDTAPTHPVSVLAMNDALQMISRPVEGVLLFDYGVPKRITELTSNHPCYLALFNHALFSRCARTGWVNMRDLDLTLNDVLSQEIPSFEQLWQTATWVERVVLAAMASVKGTHGIFTRQEIVALITRKDKKATEQIILTALESLVYRGILVKMGALGYRFFVDLFRIWLQRHYSPADTLTMVVWQKPAARPGPPPDEDTESSPAPPVAGRVKWLGGLTGLAIVGLLAFGGLVIAQKTGLLGASTPLPPQVAPAALNVTAPPPATIAPTPVPVAAPTGTPTPTAPIVVAKSLPTIAYMARQAEGPWQIYVMNTDGSGATNLSDASADDTSPVWSPAGNELAFVSQRDGNREIYVMDIQGQNLRNLTNNPADDWTPAWSPDSRQLVFASNRSGSWELYLLNADGTDLRQLTGGGQSNISPVWSADGEQLVYSSKRDGNWEIYTMRLDGTDLRRLTRNEVNDLAPVWSPDGAAIAYETNIDGNVEVYVMSASGGNPRNISNMPYANDHGPTWTPDGQRLIFYSNREGNWDLFLTDLNGSHVENLTQTPSLDEQTPIWRP